MEKAPTRAFSGLKVASTALTLVKTQLIKTLCKTGVDLMVSICEIGLQTQKSVGIGGLVSRVS